MKFRLILKVSKSRIRRFSSQRSSFGIAFDIDGVILRGKSLIGGSSHALKRLYNHDGSLRVPFLFLTNGGGIPESKRASELSGLLDVNISPLQVVQGHSPFRELVTRYKDELVVAIGKGEPASVMSEYGFRKVLSIDEYASYFQDIDPLSQYKNWTVKQVNSKNSTDYSHNKYDVLSERVKGAFVVSDPIDWGRDIQVLCDILRYGGLPGKDIGHQPPLYFAADDLEYQAAFPSERLGMGAFRIALESIFNRIHVEPLKFTSFGKPNPFVFRNAETILAQISASMCHDRESITGLNVRPFDRIYMIGDNPAVDINGVIKTGHPWFSILTRTGVFRGKDNHKQFPANLVVDTVADAIDYILEKELS